MDNNFIIPEYSNSFYYCEVDPITWTDVGEKHEFISGSISCSSDSVLFNSATLSVSEKIDDGESWIRIYIETNGIKTALFTGITSTPERKLNGNVETYDISCYSVLKPADEVLLPLGYTAKSGSSVYEIRKLLSVCNVKVTSYDNPPGIAEHIVASSTDTNLSMVMAILNAMNWRIRISGYGEVELCPVATAKDSSLTLGQYSNDYIEPSVTDTYDWYECPNVMRVTLNSKTAIARDEDPNSMFSTISRGREVWKHEDGTSLSSDENLAQLAIRRLKECQKPLRTVKYTRRYYDDVLAGDVVTLDYDSFNLTGTYTIISQDIQLGYNCKVSEEVTSL